MYLVSTTISIGIYLLAYALSTTMRKDLVLQYTLLLTDITSYGGEGIELLINRGWLEQPPQSINRSHLNVLI